MPFAGRPLTFPPWSSRSTRSGQFAPCFEDVLEEFVSRWERGESPRASEYLDQLDDDDAVDLIYQEFHLREVRGEAPDPAAYLARHARLEERLKRVFGLHAAGILPEAEALFESVDLPIAGDQIGPYHLLRALGEGGFGRVFLAEDHDLEERLVVVKVSDRPSTEPRMMARARHRNVVEVLRAGQADDGRLHWVCMPFLGGATLANILERRRTTRSRLASGTDFLDLLDAVAAPEAPARGLSRPARELIESLSFPKAAAWVFARLAEALAHAYHREVTHGDIKPSNVLITADGEPMLLDFNLAVDWRAVSTTGKLRESGTLAYMAPERLQALLRPTSPPPRPRDRHAADIYALGLVLLEVLGGEPPLASVSRHASTREVAEGLAQERASGLPSNRGLRRVPPSLRPILERCLAADPKDRYASAGHLTEDLDRWRTDRAPIHTPAPSRGQQVARWLRRNRSPLAAAVLVLGTGLASAALVAKAHRDTVRAEARAKVARIWESAELSGMRYRLPGRWTPVELGDPVKLATRRLDLYEVLGPGDWRARADVQALPAAERDDLEAWNMEHALRLAKALDARAGSAEDLRRALGVVERAAELRPARVFMTRAQDYRKRLGLPAMSEKDTGTLANWLDDYLRGIDAEDDRPVEALGTLERVLRTRPDLRWPRLRLAHLLHRLGKDSEAVDQLITCVELQPGSAWLHNEVAVGLMLLGRLEEALEHANRAVALDPDLELAYRNRLKVRARLGLTEGTREDLSRFESITSHRGVGAGLDLRIEAEWSPGSKLLQAVFTDGVRNDQGGPVPSPIQDTAMRAKAATYHQRLGSHHRALLEWDRVLDQDPNDLFARYCRAIALWETSGDLADSELLSVYQDSRLPELLASCPESVQIFWMISYSKLERGDAEEAIRIAMHGLEHASRTNRLEDMGFLHYQIASASLNQARGDQSPPNVDFVVGHLQEAMRADPTLLARYLSDSRFEQFRNGQNNKPLFPGGR